MALPRPSRLLHVASRRSYANITGAGSARSASSGLGALARERAERISSEWKGTNASGENTKNYIGGEFVESKAENFIDVLDPVMHMLS